MTPKRSLIWWVPKTRINKIISFSKTEAARQIHYKRLERKISISALARLIKVDQGLMKQYGSGSVRVPIIHLLFLQQHLDLDLNSLFADHSRRPYKFNTAADRSEKDTIMNGVLALDFAPIVLSYARAQNEEVKNEILDFIYSFRNKKKVKEQ